MITKELIQKVFDAKIEEAKELRFFFLQNFLSQFGLAKEENLPKEDLEELRRLLAVNSSYEMVTCNVLNTLADENVTTKENMLLMAKLLFMEFAILGYRIREGEEKEEKEKRELDFLEDMVRSSERDRR